MLGPTGQPQNSPFLHRPAARANGAQTAAADGFAATRLALRFSAPLMHPRRRPRLTIRDLFKAVVPCVRAVRSPQTLGGRWTRLTSAEERKAPGLPRSGRVHMFEAAAEFVHSPRRLSTAGKRARRVRRAREAAKGYPGAAGGPRSANHPQPPRAFSRTSNRPNTRRVLPS